MAKSPRSPRRAFARFLLAAVLIGGLAAVLPGALFAKSTAGGKSRTIVSDDGVAPVPPPGSRRSFG